MYNKPHKFYYIPHAAHNSRVLDHICQPFNNVSSAHQTWLHTTWDEETESQMKIIATIVSAWILLFRSYGSCDTAHMGFRSPYHMLDIVPWSELLSILEWVAWTFIWCYSIPCSTTLIQQTKQKNFSALSFFFFVLNAICRYNNN